MMIYLMEVTATDALQPYLPEGWISVGVQVNIRHLAATPIGMTVTAIAKIVKVEGGTVAFEVEAHDGVEKIGEGTHVRAALEKARFERGISAKTVKKD